MTPDKPSCDSGPIGRRDFLALMGGAGAVATLVGCGAQTGLSRQILSTPSDLTSASVTRLAQAIRSKSVSCEEVITAYLARIEQVNPRLNAIVQLTADAARREAKAADAALARGEVKGPLHGVPFTVKDTLETEGVICTGGTKGRAKFVPKADATVVARMRRAGAIMLGKTNVPELAAAYESDNLVYGRTNNPYDLARTPGGSSGGEAAIIAAGGSPLGLGTDAGGSIREPAHFCGIVGLKPTAGRVPRTGQFPPPVGARQALAHLSPTARFVEDLALVLPLIAGPDWRDHPVVAMPLGDLRAVGPKGLRVAFHTDNGIMTPTPRTVEVVRAAAKVLGDAGVSVEESRPPGIEQSWTLFHDLFRMDGGAGVRGLLRNIGSNELSPMLERSLATLFQPGMTTGEALGATARWDLFRNAMLGYIERWDAILSPIAAFPAVPHGASFDADKLSGFSYCVTYNLTGWPSVAVRAGTSPEGLPIGVQVVARPWREDVALGLAREIEAALGGWQRPAI